MAAPEEEGGKVAAEAVTLVLKQDPRSRRGREGRGPRDLAGRWSVRAVSPARVWWAWPAVRELEATSRSPRTAQ